MKPDLKILDHPDRNKTTGLRIIDYGWAKVTIETDGSEGVELTLANTLYILELTKLEILRPLP